jgi:hypothetical protein
MSTLIALAFMPGFELEANLLRALALFEAEY